MARRNAFATRAPVMAAAAVAATALFVLGACAAPAADFTGGKWRAIEIGGTAVTGNAAPSLSVTDGRVLGSTGCNRYFGALAVTGENVSFGALAASRRACSAGAGDRERRFLAALGKTRQWRIRAGRLLFRDERGETVLRFERAGTEKPK